jgi:hypothetical protein
MAGVNHRLVDNLRNLGDSASARPIGSEAWRVPVNLRGLYFQDYLWSILAD